MLSSRTLHVPVVPKRVGAGWNCDGFYTIARPSVSSRVEMLDDEAMGDVCWAINHALGC